MRILLVRHGEVRRNVLGAHAARREPVRRGAAHPPAFGTFQRDAVSHGIHDIIVICHGVTRRAFVMMWCHLSPEWFETEPNPANCAVRLIDTGTDRGYLFPGYPRS